MPDNYLVTFKPDTKRFLPRCMAKISYDDGRTWWPRGPYELHIAGNVYVLLTNGRYERLRDDEH